jgi:hypothetical protein
MQRLWAWLWVLGIGFFCGLIMIAVALGAVFPKVNSIAAPIVCPKGVFEITQQTYSYRPGSTDTMTTDYCIDKATIERTDVTGQVIFTSGTIYSLIIAAVIYIWAKIYQWRSGQGKERANQTA